MDWHANSMGPQSELRMWPAQSRRCHLARLHLPQPLFWLFQARSWLHLGSWAACPALITWLSWPGLGAAAECTVPHPSHSGVRTVFTGLLIPQNKGSKAKGLRGARWLSLLPGGS